MGIPKPIYDIWQAVSVALSLGQRAIEEIRALAREPGPKGDKGDPGMGFDNMEILHDGERTVTFKLTRGSELKEQSIVLPIVIDRGVFKEDTAYQRGDAVSYHGSMFIAQRDIGSGDRPEGETSAWRLAVKRGRNGRDGKEFSPSAGNVPFGDK